MPKKKEIPYSPDVAKLVERLGSPEYAKLFLLTLELNKLEAQHQKPDQPLVFFKEVDDIGIVTRAELNPLYEGKIPGFIPQQSFQVGAQAISRFFNTTYYKRLSVMLIVNQIEKVLYDSLTGEERRTMHPLIEKQFDKFGFPTSYRLNAEVKVTEEK